MGRVRKTGRGKPQHTVCYSSFSMMMMMMINIIIDDDDDNNNNNKYKCISVTIL